MMIIRVLWLTRLPPGSLERNSQSEIVRTPLNPVPRTLPTPVAGVGGECSSIMAFFEHLGCIASTARTAPVYTDYSSSRGARTETNVTFRARRAIHQEIGRPFPERPSPRSRRLRTAVMVLHAARRTDSDEIGVRRLRIIATAQRWDGRYSDVT